MPIFMDRHDIPDDLSAEAIAEMHREDIRVQNKYGVNFMTYWCDPARRCAFCLVEAPTAEIAIEVHRQAHGDVPVDIIPVDEAAVLAFLGRINDPTPHLSERGFIESAHRVVLFTDIVNSMELTNRLGDDRALELVRAHDGIVRTALRADGGREVKHTGDGIMASFTEAAAAVTCASAMQRGIRAFNERSGGELHVRIGIHIGAPVEDSEDLFGKTVQIAARICADASIDAIVISDDVRAALGGAFACTSLGRRVLKGVPEPLLVHSVNWED